MFFLFYTHHPTCPLTVNTNLIMVADNKTVPFLMKTEFCKQGNALKDMVKRIFFIYFPDKRSISQFSFIIGDLCIVNKLQLIKYHVERIIFEQITTIFILLKMYDTGR